MRSVEAGFRGQVLPAREEFEERGGAHRGRLATEPGEGEPVDPGQHPAVAPLGRTVAGRRAAEPPLEHQSLGFEKHERRLDAALGESEAGGECRHGNGTGTVHHAAQNRRRRFRPGVRKITGFRNRNCRWQGSVRPDRPDEPQPLRSGPEPGVSRDDRTGSVSGLEFLEERRPLRGLPDHAEREERVVELVRVANERRRFGGGPRDRFGVEHGFGVQFGRKRPAHPHRPRAALLERRRVEEGERVGVQDLGGER